MKRTPGKQRGFSLIEIIAALLLLAIAFAALMQVAGGSIPSHVIAWMSTAIAHMLATAAAIVCM